MLVNDLFEGDDKGPCWKGYRQLGMKEKNGKQVPNCVLKKQTTNETEHRFDEPLTGWHVVYRSSGNPVHGAPSFASKDEAQKFLMTKMFNNHHEFKVVHTAHVGISESLTVPLWEEQEEELRQELLRNPQVFENTSDYKSLKDFLSANATGPGAPSKSYVYASVVSILPAHSLSIANFAQPHKLIKIENNRAYFEINGKVKVYPEGSDLSGDLLKTTFLFPNIDEFEKFQTMLQLKFGDWNIKNKIIEGTNVRESDISGVMHAAKHLDKAFIITAKTAEGATKKYRVRAQSERTAKEKFSKHHSQAKILSVKEEGVAEASNDYFKRRKDEEERIAGTKAPAKRMPKQTDYEKKRKQQRKEDGVSEATGDEKFDSMMGNITKKKMAVDRRTGQEYDPEEEFDKALKRHQAQFKGMAAIEKAQKKDVGESTNPQDKITVDVPLFLRLMEYAREDAKTDMDLHTVTDRLIKLSATGQTLTMQDYDAIVNKSSTDANLAEGEPSAQEPFLWNVTFDDRAGKSVTVQVVQHNSNENIESLAHKQHPKTKNLKMLDYTWAGQELGLSQRNSAPTTRRPIDVSYERRLQQLIGK